LEEFRAELARAAAAQPGQGECRGQAAELDLAELCQKMRIPVLVQASRESGKPYLELSDRDAGLLEDYLQTIGYRMKRL
jgi:hypothetical protein